MSTDIYETWKDAVSRIATRVSKDFPDVESQDLEQGLWEVILQRKWTDPDNEDYRLILYRVAKTTAYRYRTGHLSVTAQYSYKPSEVREILETLFHKSDWPQSSVSTKFNANGNETPQWDLMDTETGAYNRLAKLGQTDDDGLPILLGRVSTPARSWDDKVAAHSDVKAAWQRLPYQYKKAIFMHYGLDVAERKRFGWKPDPSQQKQLSRAVLKLVEILNTHRGRGR